MTEHHNKTRRRPQRPGFERPPCPWTTQEPNGSEAFEPNLISTPVVV